MRFFIPGPDNDKETEELYNSITTFAQMTTGWKIKSRRIFSIRYVHSGKEYYTEVGKKDPTTHEVTMAILESNAFLVCTPSRGVVRDLPVLVGHEEIRDIVDFDAD